MTEARIESCTCDDGLGAWTHAEHCAMYVETDASEAAIDATTEASLALGGAHVASIFKLRRGVVEEWAQKMAALCEGEHAGWSIYYDWLCAFLAAAEHPERAPAPELIRGEAPTSRSYPHAGEALTPTLAAPTGAAAPTREPMCPEHGTQYSGKCRICIGFGAAQLICPRCGPASACDCNETWPAWPTSPAGRAPARAGTTPEPICANRDCGHGVEDHIGSAVMQQCRSRADGILCACPRFVAAGTTEPDEGDPFIDEGYAVIFGYANAHRADERGAVGAGLYESRVALDRWMRSLASLHAEVSRLSARPAAQQAEP